MIFVLIQELRHVKPTDGSTVAKEADNKVRNRFRNVLPCKYKEMQSVL